jgi:hypothetical protein
VGKSTPYKPEGPFAEDIKNITDLVNTVPQTQPLYSISEIMDTRAAPQKKLWKPCTLPRKEENFFIYHESVKDNQISNKNHYWEQDF